MTQTKSPPPFAHRLAKIASTISSHSALMLSDPADIRYFTNIVTLLGSEREAFVLLTNHSTHVFHGQFSPVIEMAGIQYHIGLYGQTFLKTLQKILSDEQIDQLYIDKNTLSVAEYEQLATLEIITAKVASSESSSTKKIVPPKKITLASFDHTAMSSSRAAKDPTEITQLTQASRIATAAWQTIQPQIKTGMTEEMVRSLLDQALLIHGSARPAFPTIVAFGANTALPHHQPGPQQLTPETAVLIDFGAVFQGYHSDMTRTFWFGQHPDPEFSKIEDLVQQAYQACVDTWGNQKLHPISAKTLDSAARELITAGGYGPQFIHTTGHGVGLDIHESPSISWKNETPLEPSMVVTIEPGIYLPGKFGYRYENTVLLKRNAMKELTGEG